MGDVIAERENNEGQAHEARVAIKFMVFPRQK